MHIDLINIAKKDYKVEQIHFIKHIKYSIDCGNLPNKSTGNESCKVDKVYIIINYI